jgi:D-sedoheptulose 7-phosphate isomerase
MLDYLSKTLEAVSLLAGERFLARYGEIADLLCSALERGNKILLAGNGGSAADCQHIAGELVVRFRKDRPGLPAIALTVDSSVLTACLNDFGPEPVFQRQLEALGREGDVFWAFSTSGNSANILSACAAARDRGMKVLAFTGGEGGKLLGLADAAFVAPSGVTSHIQECHIAVAHMLCHVIEERVFP